MKEGWESKELGDVCLLDKKKHDGRNLPYVGMEDISSGTGLFLGSAAPHKVKSSTFTFTQNHVLYGRLRPYLNKALIPDFTGHCSTEIFPLLPEETLNQAFLFYWLTAKSQVTKINGTCTGARMPRANFKEVLTFPIPIPPLSEQEEIVEVLDKAFAAIDQAKANIEQNIANAKELFQSKLNQIFSQKGEGWAERTLGEVCENLDSRRVPITKNKRTEGPIPYYGASGIVDYVADYIFDEDLLLVSEDGANLLARTYPIAFSISGKTWVNNHAHALRFKEMTSQIFIEHYLNSIKLDDYISGMAQPKLNQKKLNSITVPFPNLDRQEQVIDVVVELDGRLKATSAIYQTKLASLDELKKSILQKAFAGELT